MKNTKRRRIIVALTAVILVLIAVCVYWLNYWLQLNQNEKLYKKLSADAIRVTENVPSQTSADENMQQTGAGQQTNLVKQIDFNILHETNPDIYAWLTIEGTQVDYPILQNEEDNYYLKRCIDGRSGYPGCIYTNSCNAKDFSSWNTIIYGHNMSNDTMFGSLQISDDWNEKTEYIDIVTSTQTLRYHVYAVTEFSDEYLPIAYEGKSDKDREQFLKDVKEAAQETGYMRTDMEVSSEDQLVTLSTCIKGKSNKRLLVIGVLE